MALCLSVVAQTTVPRRFRASRLSLCTDHRWVFGFAHALPSFSGLSISGLSRGSGAGQHRRRLADRTVAHAHRLCLACRALFAGSHCCLHTVTPAPPSSSSSMSFSRLLSGRRPGTCPDRLNSTFSRMDLVNEDFNRGLYCTLVPGNCFPNAEFLIHCTGWGSGDY